MESSDRESNEVVEVPVRLNARSLGAPTAKLEVREAP